MTTPNLHFALTKYIKDNNKTGDFLLQQDNEAEGVYIRDWNVAGLDKPVKSQYVAILQAAESDFNKETNREARQKAYPKIGDQLDAILKYLQTQDNLSKEVSDIVSEWQTVKNRYPV